MSETKHTPGPWKVSPYHRAILQDETSRDGCCETIANMPVCSGPGHESGFNKANAELIAKAPETAAQRDRLLAALKETRGYLRGDARRVVESAIADAEK